MFKYILFFSILSANLWAEAIHSEAPKNARAEATSNDLTTAQTFRNYFLSFLEGNHSRGELDQLIYLPTEEMLKPLSMAEDTSGEDYLKALRSKYQGITQENLFEKGKNTPLHFLNRQDLEDKLVKSNLTIVLVPGIFGEFIENRVFEEFFRKNAVFDPIKKVWTSEVKDAKGRTLFKLVLLDTEEMSFESIGKIEKIGAIFSKRLEAYVKSANPQNLALLGYSLGTITALEMLAAAPERPEWVKRVKAMVSLGGAVNGSDLADNVNTPGTVSNRQMSALVKLGSSLQEIPQSATNRESAKIVKANTKAYTQFLKEMARSGTRLTPMMQIALRSNQVGLKDLRKTVKRTWEQFGLNRFTQDYSKNVERFKTWISETNEGVQELSTKNRLEWWKTHEIPPGIKYYAVGGVMGTPDSRFVKGNKLGYDLGGPDDALQFNSHEEFNLAAPRTLNDGQMALDRIQFLNDFIVRQNAEQKPIQSTLLGVVGTPHWGLALQSVYPPSVNPFPREALLKAIATSVADGL